MIKYGAGNSWETGPADDCKVKVTLESSVTGTTVFEGEGCVLCVTHGNGKNTFAGNGNFWMTDALRVIRIFEKMYDGHDLIGRYLAMRCEEIATGVPMLPELDEVAGEG